MERKPQDDLAIRRIRHLEVYSLLRSHPLSVPELADRLNITPEGAYRRLAEMKVEGWRLKMVEDPENPRRPRWKVRRRKKN